MPMLFIYPAGESTITKILCPRCKERVPRIGILAGSKIDGLTFRCKKCDGLWQVKTE